MWEALKFKHNAIQPMVWELELTQLLGVTFDEARYGLAIFSSIPLALGIRLFRSSSARGIYALLTGFLLVYYPFGIGVLHALVLGTLTYLVMYLIPRKCGTLAWLINFPYLLLVHVANASGSNWHKGDLDFTGGLMVLVLKLISVAMCYQDYYNKDVGKMTPYQRTHHISSLPRPLEYWSYIFALGNLLTGPFIEFREWRDFLHGEGVWGSRHPPSPFLAGLRFFTWAVTCLGLHLSLVGKLGVSLLATPWYQGANIVERLLAMVAVGLTVRFKYYFAWIIAEASMAFAGMDFLGWEKEDDGEKARWGRCKNVDVIKVETSDSARLYATYWNTCTGKFLRRYVYERLVEGPVEEKPTFMTLMWTQLVSALWHGLYPGYFMFFVSFTVHMQFSTMIFKCEKSLQSVEKKRSLLAKFSKSMVWRLIKVAMTQVINNYHAMAFVVLQMRETWHLWSSVYFAPHIFMLSTLLVYNLVPGRRQKKGEKQSSPEMPVPAVAVPAEDGELEKLQQMKAE